MSKVSRHNSFIPHPALQYENTDEKQLIGYLLPKSKQFLGIHTEKLG